jgi:hypothetical protein
MFAYLLTVIHLCPSIMPAKLPAVLVTSSKQVEAAASDLAFGLEEVEQFKSDRPDTVYAFNRHPMFQWICIWHFAGELKGTRVYWGAWEPVGLADHLPGYRGCSPMVRVTAGRSGIDKCAGLLFELLNRDVDKEMEALVDSSPSERRSKEEFAESCIRHEFRVQRKLEWLFNTYPFEEATRANDPFYAWVCSEFTDFETYLANVRHVEHVEANPINYYGSEYDKLVWFAQSNPPSVKK